MNQHNKKPQSTLDKRKFEIEYTDVAGETRFHEVIGRENAKAIAKRIAMASGRRAIIHQSPAREWELHVVDLETGQAINTESQLTTREAARVFRMWNARKTNALCVFWPRWTKVEIPL